MKKAIIFDMDGVLVDNRDYHLEAFRILFARHGLSATYEQMLRSFGKVNQQIFDDTFGKGRFTPDEIAVLGAEKEEIYRELYNRNIAPAPGLVPLLEGLRARGVNMAVGSSGPRRNVEYVLERCRISGFFDAIADGDMIRRGKPDPEVFLLAAGLLGIDPSDCIVFEDAVVGIQAGKHAGMTVVAMSTTLPPEMLEGSGYDRLIASFTEIDASIVNQF
jgi:beta-phosphoglucomutase family hydrolase